MASYNLTLFDERFTAAMLMGGNANGVNELIVNCVNWGQILINCREADGSDKLPSHLKLGPVLLKTGVDWLNET